MKKRIFTIFGFGLIIGGLFFGGYVLSDPIQEKVGLHILNRVAPSDLWVKARSINLVGGGTSQDAILAVGPILFDNDSGIVTQHATPGFDGETPADGIQAVGNMLFNGTDFDRGRSADATTLTDTISVGIPLTAHLSTWSESDQGGPNVLVFVTKAAGAAGVRHVSTHITACVISSTVGSAVGLQANLRDGVSGAGTILWTASLSINGIIDADCIDTSINIIGSAATAMTLDFNVAPGVQNFEVATLTGYSVQ